MIKDNKLKVGDILECIHSGYLSECYGYSPITNVFTITADCGVGFIMDNGKTVVSNSELKYFRMKK